MADPGDRPRRFVPCIGFGSIGLGLGTAIGVAVARPDDVTVAVLGDGGFMQAAAELRTAVRDGLRLVVVIANDGAYGAEWRKLSGYGLDPRYALTDWPDFRALAEAIGARAFTVKETNDIDALAAALPALDGPVLVDLRLDPSFEEMYR